MTWTVARTNAVIAFAFGVLALLYLDVVRERILPPMYDEASSFSRVDPRPGWTDTGIVIQPNRPVGIVAAGKVSTPRLAHATDGDPNRAYEIGPEGADVPEERIPDWRELDEFPAFALVGRVSGSMPFLIARGATVTTPGRLELKINCPLWDKSVLDDPGTVKRRRRSPLSQKELDHLRVMRGFFAYRTWEVSTAAPRVPHLPLTAAEITRMYDGKHDGDRRGGG
jgi:hypothetical protein